VEITAEHVKVAAGVLALSGAFGGAYLSLYRVHRKLEDALPKEALREHCGACRKEVDAYLRGVRVLGVVLPKWRGAGLKTDRCLTFTLALEWRADEKDAAALTVCGPPQDERETEFLEKVAAELGGEPGWGAEITSATEAHAAPKDAKEATLVAAKDAPVEAKAALPCACCARGQTCTVDGEAGKPATQYCPASRVSGVGKRPMAEGIHQMVADRCGANCLVPSECL